MSVWIKVTVGIVFFVIVVVCVLVYANRNVVLVGNKFIQALSNKDVQRAYDLLHSDTKLKLTFENFSNVAQKMLSSKVTKDASWSKRSVNKKNGIGMGSLAGSVILEDGKKVFVQMELLKENNEWKISYVNFEPEKVKAVLTDDMIRFANAFTLHVFENRTTEAYALLSEKIKSQSVAEDFALSNTGFPSSKVVLPISWEGFNLENVNGGKKVSVVGVMSLEDTTKAKVELTLIQENGDWRVSFLNFGEVK